MEKNGQKMNRLNALYIIQILKKYSSAQHPLSISEITDYVNKEFYRDKDLSEHDVVEYLI